MAGVSIISAVALDYSAFLMILLSLLFMLAFGIPDFTGIITFAITVFVVLVPLSFLLLAPYN
jgi:hypothetical protein